MPQNPLIAFAHKHYIKILYSDITLTDEHASRFIALRNKLKPLCDNSATLPPAVHVLWECFEFEATKENFTILQLKKVPDFKSIYETFTNDITGLYHKHPLVISLLEDLNRLYELNQTKLSLAKVVFGYIANVLLYVSTLNEIDSQVTQYNVIKHIAAIMDLTFNSNDFTNEFRAETNHLLQFLVTNSLPDYLESHRPVSTGITNHLNAALQYCSDAAEHALNLLFIATQGGTKSKLPRSTLGNFPLHPNNPCAEQLKAGMELRPILSRKPDFLEYHHKLKPIDADTAKKYIQFNAGGTAPLVGVRPARPTASHLLVTHLIEANNPADTRLVWLEKDNTEGINKSSKILEALSVWVWRTLFHAHKMHVVQVIVANKGQEWLCAHPEAQLIRSFLMNFDAILENFQHELDEVYKFIRSHSRNDQRDYLHNFIGILEALINSTRAIRVQATAPLVELDTVLKELKALSDDVTDTTFREMKVLVNDPTFTQAFSRLNISEPGPLLDKTLYRQILDAPHTHLAKNPNDTCDLNQTHEVPVRRIANNPRRAAASTSAVSVPEARVIEMDEDVEAHISTQKSAKTAYTYPSVVSVPKTIIREMDEDVEVPISTQKPATTQAKTWPKMLISTLGLSVLAFTIVAALACTGFIALPFFCVPLGLIYGGLAFASIIAGSVAALGSIVTLAISNVDSNAAYELQPLTDLVTPINIPKKEHKVTVYQPDVATAPLAEPEQPIIAASPISPCILAIEPQPVETDETQLQNNNQEEIEGKNVLKAATQALLVTKYSTLPVKTLTNIDKLKAFINSYEPELRTIVEDALKNLVKGDAKLSESQRALIMGNLNDLTHVSSTTVNILFRPASA